MGTLTWGSGITGDWNTATNWVQDRVPTLGDTAVISSGTAELISGVNPSNGITLELGEVATSTGTATYASLFTDNISLGTNFSVIENIGTSLGLWAAAGTTTMPGTIAVTNTAASMALGLIAAGTVAATFTDSGVISVSNAGILAIVGSTVGNLPTFAVLGSIVENTGILLAAGETLTGDNTLGHGAGTIFLSGTSSAFIQDAGPGLSVDFVDNTDTLELETTSQGSGLTGKFDHSSTYTAQQPAYDLATPDFRFYGTIENFASGDSIILPGIFYNSASYDTATHILDIYDTPTDHVLSLAFAPGKAYSNSNLALTANPDTTTGGYILTTSVTNPACFAEGTRIRTASGDVAIEALTVGATVATRDGHAEVRWIGRRRVDCRRHPQPAQVQPVRIAADAFADGLPARDLRLSPDHAVCDADRLIPVRYLVNGRTIRQEDVDEVTYFHLELPTHDVVFAEGLPAESYLDTGNRSSFEGEDALTLHPRFAGPAAAELCLHGPELERLKARLLVRAGLPPPLHDVRLDVDGTSVLPCLVDGERHVFLLPPGARHVRLLSDCGVPAETVAGSQDRRRLGVAVVGALIDGRALPAGAYRSGFHPPERAGGQVWRWTDGAGELQVAGDVLELRLLFRGRWCGEAGGTADAASWVLGGGAR